MDDSAPKSTISMMIVLGSVWGLSEAALGMGLRSCAAFVSGSVMTGAALFFLAAGWMVSRRISGVFLMVLIASFFKMFDALLLSLPLKHGAIGNPIFAFFMEAAAFVIIVSIIREKVLKKPGGQALLGGLSAILAVNFFPLVKYATGVPACVVAGTGYPLSLYYIHFAVLVSIVTVPVGIWVGSRAGSFESHMIKIAAKTRLDLILSPVVLIVCLAILAVLRLA
ncbi:MAG: hypothetical protein JSV17_12260 [Candidatus Aminicenantes bacterium]|nr:MAG: hypothetical protein JSV17_12260 [Candidatus Aminicenantes bacterium]